MAWAIYWVSCLDGLKMILGVSATILCFSSGFMFVVNLVEGGPAHLLKFAKWGLVIGVALALVNCFTPSGETLAAMVQGGALEFQQGK